MNISLDSFSAPHVTRFLTKTGDGKSEILDCMRSQVDATVLYIKDLMFKHARLRTSADSKYWNHKTIQYRVATINPKNHNSTKSSARIAATQIREILKDVADFGLIYNKCTFTSATISLNLELGTDVHAAFSLLDTMFRYSSTIQDEIKNLYIDVLFDDNNTNTGHYTVSIWDAGEYVIS